MVYTIFNFQNSLIHVIHKENSREINILSTFLSAFRNCKKECLPVFQQLHKKCDATLHCNCNRNDAPL